MFYVDWLGPYKLHDWASVFQCEAAGQCHGGLQTPADPEQQAEPTPAVCLPQGVPVCLQG